MTQEFSILSTHHSKNINFDFRASSISNQPLVIFLHGFKGFKDWGHFNLMADYFSENGLNVIKLNFSHNGTSAESPIDFVDLEAFGNNNFSTELNDLDDLLNHLQRSSLFEKIDLTNIHLIGHSRGGSTGILKSKNDTRITSIICWNSPLDIKNRYGKENTEWKKENVRYVYNGRTKQNMPLYYQLIEDINIHHYDTLSVLETTKTNTLIIHSKEDTTVPYQETELLSPNPNITIKLIDKGSHTLDGVHPYEGNTLPEITLQVLELSLNYIKR